MIACQSRGNHVAVITCELMLMRPTIVESASMTGDAADASVVNTAACASQGRAFVTEKVAGGGRRADHRCRMRMRGT